MEWKAPTGEAFPAEDDKEQVVFISFFEDGFNIPGGDFFGDLLFYYKLELVHLVPNSITVVSMFIHFCEAFLGIAPHYLLWRHLFYVKTTGKCAGDVGAVMFCLRPGLKTEWIDTDLPDNTAGWKSEWFYITNQQPALSKRTRHKPVKIPKWDMQLSTHEMDDIKEVLELLRDLKDRGVTGGPVARLFYRRLIQPIKDRVHSAYEYWGQSDPTREVNHKVPKEVMMTRVSQIYAGRARIKKCLKAYSLSRPADPVSPWTSRSFALFLCLCRSYSLHFIYCRIGRCSFVPGTSF
jgi:hypothetical protein